MCGKRETKRKKNAEDSSLSKYNVQIKNSHNLQIEIESKMKTNGKWVFVFAVIQLWVNSVNCLIDPISIGTIAAVGGIGYWIFGDGVSKISRKNYDAYFESCNWDWIPFNVDTLKDDLEQNLYGQHIVNTTLLAALRSHTKNLQKSQKPLVMSFHGTPGTGKNFVADRIVEHFYRLKHKSKFVHKYQGRIDFPLASEVDLYRKRLSREIINSIDKCERSIFIFDEVDKMPAGVFESIASLLDHHSHIGYIDFRKAIFIFLSNAGGAEISNALEDQISGGKYREQTGIQDFERILEAAAYNVEGGLKNAGIITSSLIDHFVPFLPLEKRHIEKCVRKEFERLGKVSTDEQVEFVATHYTSYFGKFSKYGCKRLNKKVAAMADDG